MTVQLEPKTQQAKPTKPNMKNFMADMMEKLFIQDGICPVCAQPTYRPKATHKDGSAINASACPNCGWKSQVHGAMSAEQKMNQLSNVAKKNTAIDYFKTNSIPETKAQFNNDFGNFRTDDTRHQKLKDSAMSLVDELLHHSPTHSILTGGVGRGKSHLAMAIAYEFMQESNYAKSASFINWNELLRISKKAMGNNVEDVKQYVNALVEEFDKVDLLIIDDLGIENSNGKPTEYSINTATQVLSSRSEMNLIVTTNLSATELQAAYGERCISRMLNHLNLCGMSFEGLEDYRLRSIQR